MDYISIIKVCRKHNFWVQENSSIMLAIILEQRQEPYHNGTISMQPCKNTAPTQQIACLATYLQRLKQYDTTFPARHNLVICLVLTAKYTQINANAVQHVRVLQHSNRQAAFCSLQSTNIKCSADQPLIILFNKDLDCNPLQPQCFLTTKKPPQRLESTFLRI